MVVKCTFIYVPLWKQELCLLSQGSMLHSALGWWFAESMEEGDVGKGKNSPFPLVLLAGQMITLRGDRLTREMKLNLTCTGIPHTCVGQRPHMQERFRDRKGGWSILDTLSWDVVRRLRSLQRSSQDDQKSRPFVNRSLPALWRGQRKLSVTDS